MFYETPYLKELFVDNNFLGDVDSSIINGPPALVEIYKTIRFHLIFNNNKLLSIIDFAYNKLKGVPFSTCLIYMFML